jgi:hypothetical protein
LHWYYRYWIQTTRRIDYGIGSLIKKDGSVLVELQRIGDFPMPIDLLVTYKDGSKEFYYVPMNELLGSKPVEDKSIKRIDAETWPWVNPTYVLSLGKETVEIESIEIDPSKRMADINRKNNKLSVQELKPYKDSTQ